MDQKENLLVKNYNSEMARIMSQLKKDSKKNSIYKDDPNNWVFISDGVACPDEWFSETFNSTLPNEFRRPLFILKEAYGGNEDWDEAEWFLTGKHKHGNIDDKTFKNICKWASYIFGNNYEDKEKWENDSLKKIALINIKKYHGKSLSTNSDLKEHAKKHFDLIFEQIKLIDPTIIICGYTGWLLDVIWKEKKLGRARQNGEGRVFYVSITGREIPLIDFWHPACRTNHLAEFRSDIKAIKEKTEAIGKAPYQPPKDDDSENESKDTF